MDALVNRSDDPDPHVRVAFSRRSDLPGVELRTVHAEHGFLGNGLTGYSADFEFLGPVTFHGELWHRQRWWLAAPGRLFAACPGELFVGRRVRSSGSFASLMFDAKVLASYIEEHQLSLSRLKLKPQVRMSAVLRASFLRAIELLDPNAALLEFETSLTEFLAAMLKELAYDVVVAFMARPETLARSDRDAAEHVRERLAGDTLGKLNLAFLADETGLSRFQLLRAFKRRYGLPPQSYRMCVRIALAQRMLRDGAAPAAVAFDLGFVDQSHFTRHFKRVVGVTPAAYAACA